MLPYSKGLSSAPLLLRALRTGATQSRHYAFSRYGERHPGSMRRNPLPTPSQKVPRGPLASSLEVQECFPTEEKPSSEESKLWQESNRELASNPRQSLELLLKHDTLVITREIEMINIFMGFEQANRYSITDTEGTRLGYIAEEPRGILSMFSRQLFRTHRPFRALVMDLQGSPILWIRRPFAFINSRMYVQKLADGYEFTPEGEPLLDTFAEVQQRWHLWRRRYDLFIRDSPVRVLTPLSAPQPEPEPLTEANDALQVTFRQLARIDEGFLAWCFNLVDEQGKWLAAIDRAWRGLGREFLTDTGQYFVRFVPSQVDLLTGRPAPTVTPANRQLSIDERALVLAMAMNVDFDYFSRHSEGGGHGLLWFGHWE